MMSDQYHVTVGKEKMKIDNLIYFFTRNGSKDCKLTILAVFLEKRSGKKKKCAQYSVRSRAFDFYLGMALKLIKTSISLESF